MNIRQYFMGLLLMGGMLGLGSCMSKPGILVPTNPIQQINFQRFILIILELLCPQRLLLSTSMWRI